MKTRVLLSLICAWVFICTTIAQTPTVPHLTANGEPKWRLQWHDEFDFLDTDKWIVRHQYDGNGQFAVALNSNVQISDDGHLILLMKKENHTCTYCALNDDHCKRQNIAVNYLQFPNWHYKYTSARIQSHCDFQPNYGYLEAKIAFPEPIGFNGSAFWARVQDKCEDRVMTNAGEIDIAEMLGDEPSDIWTSNIHLCYPAQDPNCPQTSTTYYYGGPIYPQTTYYPHNFLIYSVYWTLDSMIFYIDGKEQRAMLNPGVVDTVMIVLNTSLLSFIDPDNEYPGNNYLKDSMVVDWIRVWTWADPLDEVCQNTIKEPWLLNPLPDNNNTGKQTMTVMWQLDCSMPINTNCTLRYGTTPAYSISPVYLTGSTPDRLFQHTLDDLMPGTRYYYSVEIPGNPAQTYDGSFITAPDHTESSATFFAYGSTLPNPADGTLHNKVCQTMKDMMTADPTQQTLLLHTGDWVSFDSEESWSEEFFNPHDAGAQWIRSNVPIMGVIGENEKKIQTVNQHGEMVTYLPDYQGKLFQKYWPFEYDPNVANNRLFHAFDYGPVHFCLPQLEETQMLSDYMTIYNDLATNQKEWKVLSFHRPLFSLHGEPTNYSVANAIKQLAIDHGVQLVIMGHENYYAHWIEDGVHYMILGNGGSGTEGIDDLLLSGSDVLSASTAPHFARFSIEDDMMFVDVIQGADWNGTQTGHIIERFAIPKTTHIQSNTVWQQDPSYPVIVSNIEIAENVSLEVKSEVQVAQEGEIIVSKGAGLIMNMPVSRISGTQGFTAELDLVTCDANGNVTNSYKQNYTKDPNFWQGIRLLGDNAQNQSVSCKGVNDISNGAVLENAVMAIATLAPGAYVGSIPGTGGIIRANNATFRNCQTAVKMYPFRNNGANYATSIDQSYFRNCTFVTDDDYLLKGVASPTHMDLDGIYQLRIQGCSFRNDETPPVPGYLYASLNGTGIMAMDASVVVTPLCTTQTVPCGGQIRNQFINLHHAIHITQPLTSQGYNTLIKEADFTGNYRAVYANSLQSLTVHQCSLVNNYRGIYLLSSQSAKVTDNHVEIPQSYAVSWFFPYGLYLDAGDGFTVEGNSFINNLQTSTAFGVLLNNTGARNNEIYRNTFEGLTIGIMPQFRNKGKVNGDDVGLCLFCNEFDNTGKDIMVGGRANSSWYYRYIGIHPAQQISIWNNSTNELDRFPAGNLFSPGNLLRDPASDDHDFSNHDADHLTYAYDPNSANGRMDPYVYSNIDLKIFSSGANQCMPKAGNIHNLSQGYAELASAQVAWNSSKLIRDIWKNGGIDDLEQQVELVLPWEAYQQYNELMSISPYVAADALIAMIENPSFTDLMVKLVCVANPHSSRNDAVLEALYNRNPPMPESYIEEILDESGTYSPLEELENNAAADYHLVRMVGNEILHLYYADTVNVWATDSITQFLSRLPGLEDRYIYALHALRTGDFNTMQSVLDAIPYQFELSERENIEYGYMTEVFSLLAIIYEHDLQPGDLTGEQTEPLMLMLETEGTVNKALAISILLWNDPYFEYNEPILEPTGYQMRKARPQKSVAKQTIELKLYPNPARDYFTVFYKVPDAFRNSLSLQVKDASGRIVLQQPLPDNAFEYMIDTGTLAKGVYTVVLLNNNSLLKGIHPSNPVRC
jgi:beta-glucanase (GH16 family)